MTLLTLLICSPLFVILLLSFLSSAPTHTKKTAVILGSIIPVLLSFWVWKEFRSGETLWFSSEWITFGAEPSFTISFDIAVNGFSVLMLVLTTVLTCLSLMTAALQVTEKFLHYAMLTFALELGVIGVFAAQNLVLFFIFLEVTLLPMFLLIAKWGGAHKEKAAYSYLLYNGIGSAFLLLSITLVLAQAGTTSYDVLKVTSLEPGTELLVLCFMLIAFAVKLPIVPLHTWMVRVHVEAPPALVMIHAGVLLKIAAYGLVQFGIGLFPTSFDKIALILAILGLVNVLYGALIAFVQKEIRAVFAYSSISHMGLVLLGAAVMNEAGVQGAIFHSISHGLIAALVFFLIGTLLKRTGTTQLQHLSGLARSMPLFAGVFLAAGLASLGLPGMSGFVGEFMTFLGVFKDMPVLGGIGVIGIILAAVYILRVVLDVTFGKDSSNIATADLQHGEWVPVTVLLAGILLMGLIPDVVTGQLDPVLKAIFIRIGG
ncbi:NuoM family protein [Pontibacillus salicampi]|uniref:NuoM family protein n=1 Tax=Pontibacillus salicampi TaxID=1449801 RepID=A0ABV6LSL4_9BACI